MRIKERYRERTERASRLEAVEKIRTARAEHGVGSLSWLPLLLQIPLTLALFRLLVDVARGVPVGAMSAALVASAGAASLFGARLAASAQLGWAVPTVTVAAVVTVTAVMTYAGARLAVANLPTLLLDGPVGSVQRVMPVASAVGICISAFALPLGVIVYWLVSATWTVGQQLVINRWAPTAGSAAAASR
jgi:YidC/Oxa1 family membrane protein insertase